MKIDLSEIRTKTLTVNEYIEKLEEPFRQNFLNRKQTYTPKPETLDSLRKITDNHMIIAFCAGWCKDCTKNIPVLALIAESTGLEVRVFGGFKRDPLSSSCKWRIPPSPPEVQTFNVDKIPLMIVFDKEGNEVGRIVENPKVMPTLEEEICEIIKSSR
jgi:hypothetical protein